MIPDAVEVRLKPGDGAVIELHYNFFPADSEALYDVGMQFYRFYDFGAVWERKRKDERDLDNGFKVSIASAGGGLCFNVDDNLSGYFEIGTPLTKPRTSSSSPGPRGFFSLVGRF